MVRIIVITGWLAVLLSSCSPAAEPLINPTQIEGTTVALANAMLTPHPNITATALPGQQAAIESSATPQANATPASTQTTLPPATAPQQTFPTATPVPPTIAPSATSMGGLAFPVNPTATAVPNGVATGAGDCTQPMDVADAGPKARMLIKNDTQAPIVVVMGISARNSYGQCGYMSWGKIGSGDSVAVQVPQILPGVSDHCYWVNAWIYGPQSRSLVSDGGFCINTPQKWVLNIHEDRIRLLAQ